METRPLLLLQDRVSRMGPAYRSVPCHKSIPACWLLTPIIWNDILCMEEAYQ